MNGQLKPYFRKFEEWHNPWKRSKVGRVTLLKKSDLRDFKLKKDEFILRITSKEFKKLYKLERKDDKVFVTDIIPYDILYRKALAAVKEANREHI